MGKNIAGAQTTVIVIVIERLLLTWELLTSFAPLKSLFPLLPGVHNSSRVLADDYLYLCLDCDVADGYQALFLSIMIADINNTHP